MIKKQILLMALLLCISINALAQSQHGGSSMEASQDANASKGSAGSGVVNVDMYTGTASVNIPIHEFVVDGMNAGVSFSYVAKGIRVDELASSIGLGWQLNAGGSITREVMGIEDEITIPAYFKDGAVTYPSHDSNTFDYLQGALAPNAHAPLYSYQKDDEEHDLFHVNMLGRSFTFSMKRNDLTGDLEFACQPYNQVKIELTSEDYSDGTMTQLVNSSNDITCETGGKNPYEGVIKFKIIDEKGNQFFFERGDYELKDYKVDGDYLYYNNEGAYFATRKWNLIKAISYTGKQIDFIYDTRSAFEIENITETLYEQTVEAIDDVAHTVTYDPLEIKEHTYFGTRTHIKEIHYPNGTKVYFDIDKGTATYQTARLDNIGDWIVKNIKVEHSYNANITNSITFKLNYAYFNTPKYGYSNTEFAYTTFNNYVSHIMNFPAPNNTYRDLHMSRGLRLKLESIERLGFDESTTKPYYSFEYNATPLPYRFSERKDYYGYYNGKQNVPYIRSNFLYWLDTNSYPEYDTFKLSIPYHQDAGNTYSTSISVVNQYWGQDRSYDADSAQACVLWKVINAYGGSEEIHYGNYGLSNPSGALGYHDLNKPCMGGGNPIGIDIDTTMEGKTVNDGLCVDYIELIDGYSDQHTIRTEYSFISGERFHPGGYTWYKRYTPSVGHRTVRTNHFVSPRVYYNGSNHGFTTVRVKQLGKNTSHSGPFFTVILSDVTYTFSNLMYYDASYPYNSGWRSCLSRPTFIDYRTLSSHMETHRMGLLLKKEEFDHNGQHVLTQENTYTEVYDPNTSEYSVWNTRFFKGPCNTVSFSFNQIDDKRMLLTSQSFTRPVNVLGTSSNSSIITQYNYTYDEYDNLKLTTWVDSKSQYYKKYIKYNYDYPAYSNTSLAYMNNAGLQFQISQEAWKMNSSHTDSSLLDLSVSPPSNYHHFNSFFTLINHEPVPSSTVSNIITGGGTAIKMQNIINYESSDDYGDMILNRKHFTVTDGTDVLEKRLNDQDIYSSAIYDDHGKKVAVADNAQYKDIAFTSFEVQKGRWNYDEAHVSFTQGAAVTGSHVYELVEGMNDIQSPALSEMEYIVAFWLKSTTTPVAELVTPGSGSAPLTPTLQNTVGAWSLYTVQFGADSNDVFKLYNNTPSTSMEVDELRLHPAGATFESYTNLPLCGITTKCNNSNYITYMEYDMFGQLTRTRDIRGNILSKLERFAQHDDDSGGGTGCGTCDQSGGGTYNQ